MNLKAKLVLIAAAVVVAGITIAFLLRARRHEHAPLQPTAQSRRVQPTYAASGQMIAGFPSDVLVGGKPEVTQSYAISSSSEDEYTTSYTSVDSADTLLQNYISKLQAKGYGILSKEQSSGRDAVYAASKSADISVLITPVRGGTSIVVSYLQK